MINISDENKKLLAIELEINRLEDLLEQLDPSNDLDALELSNLQSRFIDLQKLISPRPQLRLLLS
jgi:hypothetical protein